MSLHLVIGGVRSGKSELAERLAGAAGAPVCFVATGSPGDPEMVERIARHRRRRPIGWRTVESDDPPAVLGLSPPPPPAPAPSRWRSAPPAPPPPQQAAPEETVLVDGIGPWIARLMVDEGLWTDAEIAPLGHDGEASWERLLDQVRALAHAAATRQGLTVVVAEEGGLGLVPQGAGARRYLDLMGEATQLLAKAAARVELVVAGQVIGLEPAAARPRAAAGAGPRAEPAGGPAPTPPPPLEEHLAETGPARTPGAPPAAGPAPAARAGAVPAAPDIPATSRVDLPVADQQAPPPPDLPGAPTAEPPGPPAVAGRPAAARPPGQAPGRRDGTVGPAPPGWDAPAIPAAAAARAIPAELRLHGDTVAGPDQLDFAVNVIPGGPPAWLRGELLTALGRAGSYPDQGPAIAAIADRHGRDPAEVLPTNGSAEAFWLLASVLRPARPVVVHPSFTEPEVALRVAGHTVQRAYRHPEDFGLDPAAVPDDADLVVVGNPNNPTGNLDGADRVAELARPGRVLVVDEAFMEFTTGADESLAGRTDLPGLVVVVRSLTKLWALPGVRAGYLLCARDLAATLRAARQPWSVNTVACAALAACAGDRGTASRVAERVAAARDELVRALERLPDVRVWPSAANFLLLRVPGGPAVRSGLAGRGVAVRPGDSFPGLGPDYVRVAVRSPEDNRRLVAALGEVLG